MIRFPFPAAELCISLSLIAAVPCSALQDTSLLQAAKAEQPAAVETLNHLVNIETGTGDKVGMAEMANCLEQNLRAIGADVKRYPAAYGGVGENVVGRLQQRKTHTATRRFSSTTVLSASATEPSFLGPSPQRSRNQRFIGSE